MPTIHLVQYWHSANPPDDVSASMATWEDDPAFTRTLFTEESADAFIEEHFDHRTVRAFRSCAIPAMQADMLRYAALFVHGGAYVDVNLANRGHAADLFRSSGERGLLYLRGEDEEPPAPGLRPGRIVNGLMFFRRPRDPLMHRVLRQATTNVLDRSSNNVWEVTGPGILTEIYQGPDADTALRGFTLQSLSSTHHALEPLWLSHKGAAGDWRHHLDKEVGTIYREVDRPGTPPRAGHQGLPGRSVDVFRKLTARRRRRPPS